MFANMRNNINNNNNNKRTTLKWRFIYVIHKLVC